MKPICIVQAPYATRSGYGDMSRDIIRHIVALDRYDIKLVSMPWGACPMNALSEANPKDTDLIKLTTPVPINLPRQPELFIQISVPNEFRAMAKFNIGITAGIETTLCSKDWIDGCNRMDVIFTISEHSKRVLETTTIEEKSPDGQIVATHKITKPIEVLHNCVDTDIFKELSYKEVSESIKTELSSIKEDFCYLFVGHWLKGNVGEDRKNLGLLIQVFCETFKNKASQNKPALIVKTSGATFSVMDQLNNIAKIKAIREHVGAGCPNVYLLHGDLSEAEMNSLYNHPKVKVHVTFTKGEGFGRPLLEATQSAKPVIASGWSGHLDFLNPTDAILLGGELKNVEPGAVWPGVILAESQWFNVDVNVAANALAFAYKNYSRFLDGARRLAKQNKKTFGYGVIQTKTKELMDKYVPRFAMEVPLQLPTLKKITPNV
jgi:glycosyltransferase involved in cell wall biosynthesis